MTLYLLVLFVHVIAALGLSAALSFESLSLFQLRRVSNTTEVRRWIEPVPGLPWVAMGSMILIFFSGIYLAAQISAWSMAWPKMTIGALLLIAPARRSDWQTHACDPPGLFRCEGDQLRTAESPARSVFEDLARHPNRCLPWHCPADGHQAGIVGVGHRCGNLDNSRCFIVRSCRALQRIVVRT